MLKTTSPSLQDPPDRVLRWMLILTIWLFVFPQISEASSGRYSSWWEKVDAIDQELQKKRYKPAAKAARKWIARISKEAWRDPELRDILAELSLYQAIAAEHLGDREAAIWYWQVAQNLEPKIQQRNLNAYGVGELFHLNPKRKLGQAPNNLQVEKSRRTREFKPAKQIAQPTVAMELVNSMAATEGSRNFEAEFIVDQRGHVLRPVVTSTRLHPIVLYAALESFRGKVLFEPASLNGEPVAVLMPVVMNFESSRW